MDTKQIIIMRKDLKMRRGKEIAQGAHASISFLTRRLQSNFHPTDFINVEFTDAMKEWMNDSFAKICLQVNSEAELEDIAKKAKEAGLECHLITDSGRTEFNGVPTKTCLAIGPDYCDKIDKITSHLQLY